MASPCPLLALPARPFCPRSVSLRLLDDERDRRQPEVRESRHRGRKLCGFEPPRIPLRLRSEDEDGRILPSLPLLSTPRHAPRLPRMMLSFDILCSPPCLPLATLLPALGARVIDLMLLIPRIDRFIIFLSTRMRRTMKLSHIFVQSPASYFELRVTKSGPPSGISLSVF